MRFIGMIDETEKKETAVKADYDGLKKSDLIALCEERGIELTPADKRSKETLVAALENEPED